MSIGVMQLGITRYWAGVIPGKRMIFLGRNGQLWRFKHRQLPGKAANPLTMDADGKSIWMETYRSLIEDLLCPAEEIQSTKYANWRYRATVKELVRRRIDEARDYDRDLSPTDFARGVCESWSHIDLLNPRYPTVQHALFTALVLALERKQAAELIELGALMEYRVPLVTRHMAGQMYDQGIRLLARLCPAWYSEGWALDWKLYGSIDRYFRREFAKTISLASTQDADFAAVHGKLRRGLPPVGRPTEEELKGEVAERLSPG